MTKGQILKQGDKLYSPNKLYSLIIDAEGNLIITDDKNNSYLIQELKSVSNFYHSSDQGKYSLILQHDGHLCIVADGAYRWGSGKMGDKVELQDDGRIVQYLGSYELWSTGFPVTTLLSDSQAMTKGQILKQGDALYSPNKLYALSINAEGNLIITDDKNNSYLAQELKSVSRFYYSSDQGKYSLTLQHDGHLCIVAGGAYRWGSGKMGDKVELQDDGRLVQYLGSDELWSTGLPKSSFNIEVLGRQGKLEFSKLISLQPTTASITLYDSTMADSSSYKVINGNWVNDIFTGDIVSTTNSEPVILPGLEPDQTKIKLKFTSGTYKIVGTITSSMTNLELNRNKNTLVLGYSHDYPQTFKSSVPPIFSLVINDKDAGVSTTNRSDYSYGWYIEPSVAVDKDFRMVHLVKDEVLDEVALYAFENKDSRTLTDALSYKILYYKKGEIKDALRTFLPNVEEWDFISDLAALLINKAQLKYPSQVLGFKSSGHGTPNGIMNGFFNEDWQMKRSLTWINNIKKDKVDFMDFSTNCNVASFYNLNAVYPFVKYVVASDLTRSSPLPFDLYSERPDVNGNYATYFANTSQPVPEILEAIINKYDALYKNQAAKDWASSSEATKNGRTLASWKQQLTLFDMTQFIQILSNIGGESSYENCIEKSKTFPESNYYLEGEYIKQLDFKTGIPLLFPNYTSFNSDWNKFAMKQISNRDQFRWDTDSPKGLIFNRRF